ncbi:hypothetical protein SADUNF_Sadunf13G0023600 [Salix dunnii]|uniref:Uncharacterized protein n=1 Tax=Salix dunnii TaxID=1413687 RepID=A0A835JF15_9ROSI|nr:hypothetical protein SADUNF_Sadunf13G0023600 [Salix dunnii]
MISFATSFSLLAIISSIILHSLTLIDVRCTRYLAVEDFDTSRVVKHWKFNVDGIRIFSMPHSNTLKKMGWKINIVTGEARECKTFQIVEVLSSELAIFPKFLEDPYCTYPSTLADQSTAIPLNWATVEHALPQH